MACRVSAYLGDVRFVPGGGNAVILDAARAAASQLFSPEFRAVFLKTLGLTLLALVALWFGLTGLVDWLALPLSLIHI